MTKTLTRFRRLPKKVDKARKDYRTLYKAFYAFLCLLISFLSANFAEPFFRTQLPKAHHPAEIYASALQNDLRGTLVQAIRSATHSVHLMVYSLTDRTILHALKEKAAEGIPVRVVVDNAASLGVDKLLGRNVKTILRSGTGLMHLKILIIDESQIWCGSANMTYESFNSHHNLVLAMEHKELAQNIIAHAMGLTKNAASPKTAPLYFTLDAQQGELWFLPQKAALQHLCDMIDTAKKTLRVAMFTWTHPLLADRVIAAKGRGVHVEVCVDRNQTLGTNAATIGRLRDANIAVRTNEGNKLLHHKCMWIDDQILVSGSANWTRAAIKQNDDFFVVLRPLTDKQNALMDTLWQHLRNETQVLCE